MNEYVLGNTTIANKADSPVTLAYLFGNTTMASTVDPSITPVIIVVVTTLAIISLILMYCAECSTHYTGFRSKFITWCRSGRCSKRHKIPLSTFDELYESL